MPLRTWMGGLRSPEAPRRLLGQAEVQLKLQDSPSGLGWRPDGRLQLVSMPQHRLRAKSRDGDLQWVADLSAHVGGPCIDMAVDALGRACVGNFGFDPHARAAPRASDVLRGVSPAVCTAWPATCGFSMAWRSRPMARR
jgi:hypothetical protein